jgi:hypothetical protein
MESKMNVTWKQKEREYGAKCIMYALRNNTTSITKQSENLDEAQLWTQEAQKGEA